VAVAKKEQLIFLLPALLFTSGIKMIENSYDAGQNPTTGDSLTWNPK